MFVKHGNISKAGVKGILRAAGNLKGGGRGCEWELGGRSVSGRLKLDFPAFLGARAFGKD